jgi:hypothetical protein
MSQPHSQGHSGELTQLGLPASSCCLEWRPQEPRAPLQQAILPTLSSCAKRISPKKNGVRSATSKTSVAATRGTRHVVWHT